jgi:ubiquinone/menaquinone biosynthesis C-methylase UbiE
MQTSQQTSLDAESFFKKESREILAPFLKDDRQLYYKNNGIALDPNITFSPSMLANAYFFGHPSYGKKYFETENRSPEFIDRWQAAIGTLDDKIVIDVGCGPGNLLAAIGGTPKVLIGTDVSEGALLQAQKLGYTTVLSDAQDVPLIDQCADVVLLNAVMHHSDDFEKVLREAARLVRPGGLLVTDMDPQKGAWNFKGLGLFLYKIRYPVYKFLQSDSYKTQEEHILRLITEVHNHQPGEGIDVAIYETVLSQLGFDYKVCPHNHFIGREVLDGIVGQPPLRFWLGQWLSGIQPGTKESGLSIMCVAHQPIKS